MYLSKYLRNAFKDPNLNPPKSQGGTCRYITEEGKRCIVGTILHQAGCPDRLLVQNNNGLFRLRSDLQEWCKQNKLTRIIDNMATWQYQWDDICDNDLVLTFKRFMARAHKA